MGMVTKQRRGLVDTLAVLARQKYLLLMSVPFMIWLFIFRYIPLWGWTMAFQQYRPGVAFMKQKWVGLKYFIEMFNDPQFYLVMRNTLVMSFLGLLIGFTLPIVLAIMINEVRSIAFKKTIQTISYLPHFVSWVIVASMFSKMLSTDNGAVNQLLMALGLIPKPVQFMAVPRYFWWIITFADLWKEIGWNSIIFLAAIAGIPQELYEAARVDGAGRFRSIWHITLPGILTTIMVILIMNIGHFINIGFEKQFLMRNNIVREYSDVLDIYILDRGINAARFAFGTAAGIFRSVVSVILIFAANSASRKTLGIRVI
jgi:putative aldouronate transport system permease protein